MPTLETDLAERLAELESGGLRRWLRRLDQAGPVVRVGEREVLNFCSNDYLGLGARHVETKGSAGSPSSRLVTGNELVHEELEHLLAAWVGLPSALLFSSGYAANVGTLGALLGRGDLVVSDQLNHASLIDGCRLARAEVQVLPHLDLDALEDALRGARAHERRVLVVHESIYSMDGDGPDLPAVRSLCDRYGAWWMLDEAHALGVCGPSGAGRARAEGVVPDVLVGTLGKSVGAGGAFVAGAPVLREWLINRARSFVFSTAVPAAQVRVTHAQVKAAMAADELRARLMFHVKRLREGLVLSEGPGAIVPLLVGSNEAALQRSRALLERGLLVGAIRPPTVPAGTARLRITPMATHTDGHIDQLLDALTRLS